MAEKMDRQAEYYKLLSEFHDKQAKLEEMSKTFEIHQKLRSSNSVSEVEYLASKFACEGLKKQNDDLRAAIATLEPSLLPVDNANEILKPEQIRILEIQSELADAESLLDASRIVAPVAGRIIKRKCNAGEYVDPNVPIVELLQAGSAEGVVYLPQQSASLLKVDDTIELIVVPLGARQVFRVHRISPELVPPPQALRASYRAFKGLVRVHAVPIQVQSPNSAESPSDLSSWIGAELALPRFFFRVTNPTLKREYSFHSFSEGT
jgi:multidrug efflux pump subunit AcrA (membrane-fusion protein)